MQLLWELWWRPESSRFLLQESTDPGKHDNMMFRTESSSSSSGSDITTDLIDSSKGSRTKDSNLLKLGLFQDPQQGLVWSLPTGSQGLHQLKHTGITSDITHRNSSCINRFSLPPSPVGGVVVSFFSWFVFGAAAQRQEATKWERSGVRWPHPPPWWSVWQICGKKKKQMKKIKKYLLRSERDFFLKMIVF